MPNYFIVIDINSDTPSVTYPCNTDEECTAAAIALRDAGLAYEYLHTGDPGCPDAYETSSRLYAAEDWGERNL